MTTASTRATAASRTPSLRWVATFAPVVAVDGRMPPSARHGFLAPHDQDSDEGVNSVTELGRFQAGIEATFGERDRARGVDGTFRWFVEEVGEVAKALRQRDPAELEHEVGDALAWLTSVANLVGVDLERAATRFANGCPRCGQSPCRCPMA